MSSISNKKNSQPLTDYSHFSSPKSSTRAKVENFRSVVDSGWIDAEQVTALIGVNESGKTNLLLPLWKLNPADEGEIRPTSDYPKSNFAAIRAAPEKFYFIHAHFDTENTADELARLTGLDRTAVDTLYVAKNYAGEVWIDFPKARKATTAKKVDLVSLLDGAASEISSMTALNKEGSIKPEFLSAIEAAKSSFEMAEEHDVEAIASAAASLKGHVPEAAAPTSSIVPRFNLMLEALASVEAKLRAPAPSGMTGVSELVMKALPKFVYYSNYGNLDSEIYLPHFVENLQRDDLGAREAAKARTLRVLFSFVRLKPEEILELGREVDTAQRTPTPEEIAETAPQ